MVSDWISLAFGDADLMMEGSQAKPRPDEEVRSLFRDFRFLPLDWGFVESFHYGYEGDVIIAKATFFSARCYRSGSRARGPCCC